MIFKPLDDADRWNALCQSFWQSTEWQRYAMNARTGVECKNHSFFVDDGIVPLIQEGDQFTFQGGATPEFICKPEHKKHVLAEIKRLALENGVKRIHIRGNVRGYLDASTYTCIMDPANPQPTKGHKSAIRKAEKYLGCHVTFDINSFRDDYYRIAGKITRPPATFAILGDWMQQGIGSLVKAVVKATPNTPRKDAGYTYILHWHKRSNGYPPTAGWAYYFMSCVEPEFKQYNVSHRMQQEVCYVLWQKGIRQGAYQYELGEQVYNSLHCQPTAKERNISLFKRGFGGRVVISPASEYFFDADYMQAVYTERVKQYAEAEYEKNIVHE